MIFELTQDYQILVPLMIANLLSFLISRQYQPKPLYRALLEQDDVHLPEPATRSAVGAWRARDIMTRDIKLVPPQTAIEEAAMVFSQMGVKCLPVGGDGALLGLLTIERANKAIRSGAGRNPVGTIVETNFPHAHSDHPLELAIERLRRSPGLLPVLDRRKTNYLEGVITPQTVARFIESSEEGGLPIESGH